VFTGDVGLAKSAAEAEVHPAVVAQAVDGDVLDGVFQAFGFVTVFEVRADGIGWAATAASAAFSAPSKGVVAVGALVWRQFQVSDD